MPTSSSSHPPPPAPPPTAATTAASSEAPTPSGPSAAPSAAVSPRPSTPLLRTPVAAPASTSPSPSVQRKQKLRPATMPFNSKSRKDLFSVWAHPGLAVLPSDAEEAASYPKIVGVRPNVNGWEVVEESAAKDAKYFPHLAEMALTLTVGNDEGVDLDLGLFQTYAYPNGRERALLNAGGSVWGLDWAPSDNPGKQYLAVGGYKGNCEEHHLLGVVQESNEPGDMNGCLQIWAVPSMTDRNPPYLEMGILHEKGVIYDLKIETATTADGELPRLGMLAVAFGDGSVCLLTVPHPSSLRKHWGIPEGTTIFVKPNEFAFTSKLEGLPWRISWDANGLAFATGCTSGGLESERPQLYFPVHDSAIYSLEWLGPPKSQARTGEPFQRQNNLIVSGGCDGRIMMVDLRDAFGSIQMFRIRGFATCAVFSSFLNGFLISDAEHSVRFFRPGEVDPKASKSQSEDDPNQRNIHTSGIASHPGGLWDLDTSPYLPCIVSVGADGFCKITNANRLGQRSHKLTQAILYRLELKEDGRLAVGDGLPDEVYYQIVSKGETPRAFKEPEIAIQKVRFNRNADRLHMVASAGVAGLVRVETVYG
ncbi:WD40-repeat-containing domain protein [Zopfochytrium polystomum]|nr:WD40-repeat-containing domain protein [Zopfochytrium polystomum]